MTDEAKKKLLQKLQDHFKAPQVDGYVYEDTETTGEVYFYYTCHYDLGYSEVEVFCVPIFRESTDHEWTFAGDLNL